MGTNKFTNYQIEFFKRINREPKIIKTIKDIENIMIACSEVFSFENLDLVTNKYEDLTKEILIKQTIYNKQGGMCYKGNSIINYFLKEFGFDIYLTRGTVENQITHSRWNIPTGHMINILNFESKLYVIDIAFGCTLSMCPVPITENGEETISSIVGEFRSRRQINIVNDKYHYTHILEFKRPKTFNIIEQTDWMLGYAFDPLYNCCLDEIENKTPPSQSQQTQVQKSVLDDPYKDFSVKPLVCKIINNESNATLTFDSFTLTNCKTGDKIKNVFEKGDQLNQFNIHLVKIFNLPPILALPLE